jgi:hypothetical protein
MLRLTSHGIMSRLGGGGGLSARGLLGRADSFLSKELRVVRTSEIALSSFTFGALQGRFKAQGGLTVFALPVDLLAGATCHVLGLFGFARPYAHHLHAVGDGALASFFTTTGYRVGERMAAGGGLMKGLAGMFGDVGAASEPAGGAAIADKELLNLVRE